MFVCGVAAALGILFSASPARAATYVWNDGSGDGLWDTSSLNWTGSAWSGSSNDTATFSTLYAPGAVTVTGTQSVGPVNINIGGYTFNGPGVLNLSGTMTIKKQVTINSAINGSGSLLVNATPATTQQHHNVHRRQRLQRRHDVHQGHTEHRGRQLAGGKHRRRNVQRQRRPTGGREQYRPEREPHHHVASAAASVSTPTDTA